MNKVIKKGKLEMVEKNIESKEGFITITSICSTNCNFAMAKLNAIEILPLIEVAKPMQDQAAVEVVKCGGSLVKGIFLINLFR